MNLQYFVVDAQQQLWKTPASMVEGFWCGSRTARDFKYPLASELRVVTALCDRTLEPRILFFLRLELTDGVIAAHSRQLAYQSVRTPNQDSERILRNYALAYQANGWPQNWPHQLAVALDTPVRNLRRVAIGGPLPVADLLGVSVVESIAVFAGAIDRKREA